MEQLLLLCACFLLGIVLGRSGRMPANAPQALNGFIINVSLPALALLHIHELRIDASLLAVIAVPWALFLIGALFFPAVGRRLGFSRGTIGCLMLAGALGNTSFVGLPMIEAFFGHDALGIGIIADQPGTFLILSTLGLMIAARASSGDVSAGEIARRVLRFPPFIAMLLALLLLPVGYPGGVSFLLGRLGDTLTPIALVSVGLQLRLSDLRGNGRKLGIGLFYKLLLGPALLLVPILFIPALHGRTMQVALFEAAMPPMITGGIVAMEHDLDPPLATLLLGIGIPLSFLTLPVWWWVLRGVL
jgi:predicted permease